MNSSRLINVNFSPELVSSLVIHRYYCIIRLRRNKKFHIHQVEEFRSTIFFERRSVKFAVRPLPYKNERKKGEKGGERNRNEFDSHQPASSVRRLSPPLKGVRILVRSNRWLNLRCSFSSSSYLGRGFYFLKGMLFKCTTISLQILIL